MGTYGNMVIDGFVDGSMQNLPTGYGMTGFPNYAGWANGHFVFNFSTVAATGFDVLWIDSDQDPTTGYNGYDYHIIMRPNLAPALHSGAQGETFITNLTDWASRSYGGSPMSGNVQEFALPSALIGGSTSAIFTSFGYSHVIAAPVAPGKVYGSITLDGSLSDWTPNDRIDWPVQIGNLEVWGKIDGGAMIIAMKVSDSISYTIGPETRIWLNTDMNNMTGSSVPYYNMAGAPSASLGVEYNIRLDAGSHPILDTNATKLPKPGAGLYADIMQGILDYGVSANGKIMEIAVPLSALGNTTGMLVHIEMPGVGAGPYPQFAGKGYEISVNQTPPIVRPPIILPPPPPPYQPPPPPPMNHFPTITSYSGGPANVAVVEGTIVAATMSATDPDAGQTLTYSLVGGADRDLFTINPVTGVISFKNAPDFEVPTDLDANNVYEVIAYVIDGAGGMGSQHITVTVTNNPNEPAQNFAPVIISNGGGLVASVSAAENQTAVTTVQATDNDAGQTLSYVIVGGDDAALFDINPTTGALTFKNAPDYEAPADANRDNAYLVFVGARDSAGGTDNQSITVNVTNVADTLPPPPPPPAPNVAPRITSNGGGSSASISVAENTLAAVTTVRATDGNAAQVLAYSLSGTDADLFAIDAATGVLTFKNAPDYEAPADNGANNTYNVTVLVDDGAGGSDTQALSIRVTNVNGVTRNGGSGADALTGSGENDWLYGKGGADTLTALGGNDYLEGASGNDALDGGAGADELVGGAGADTMTGGAGADTFVYWDMSESTTTARDVITDFTKGADKIDLSDIDARTNTSGNQAFTLLAQDAAITGAGQLAWSYVTVNGVAHTLIQGNVNSNLAPDFAILLVGQVNLSASDFIL